MSENYPTDFNTAHPPVSVYSSSSQNGVTQYMPNPQGNMQMYSKSKNVMAITGFVLSMVGLVFTIVWFSFFFTTSSDLPFIFQFLLSVLAFVFSIVGITRVKRLNGSGLALSVIGIIVSILVFLSTPIALIYILFFGGMCC
ncbi:MAG: hypothetical protein IKS49_03675 [Actinomycetaceae bacterium]|nr:hypothetical protein [Actinomycetaceae bacterium]